MPLAFVIARYFAYAFVDGRRRLGARVRWSLSAAINLGWVYEASWGPANAREVAAQLAERGGPGSGRTSRRRTSYARRRRASAQAAYDGPRGSAPRPSRARRPARRFSAEPGSVTIEGGGSGLTYAAFPLGDGGACALVSEYLPQWASRDLVGVLPNPQNLMLAAGLAGSALSLALIARRASRVIARKMAPLAEAAERVGREELDFSVGRTNVREVNDVLAAMDAMRSSLASSLEARWEAERAQREQVASLAHDLKTPLTVLRANADFVAEELSEGAVPGERGRAELAAAARDISGGAERLDGYVRLLIETSRGAGGGTLAPVRPAELCEQVVAEAEAVARARGVGLAASVAPSVSLAPEAPLDRAALARAAANLVANASEHAMGARRDRLLDSRRSSGHRGCRRRSGLLARRARARLRAPLHRRLVPDGAGRLPALRPRPLRRCRGREGPRRVRLPCQPTRGRRRGDPRDPPPVAAAIGGVVRVRAGDGAAGARGIGPVAGAPEAAGAAVPSA